MVPSKGKIYEIEYWDDCDKKCDYVGLAICTGEGPVDETDDGTLLYLFEMIENLNERSGVPAMFACNDIIREVYAECDA